MPASLSRRTAMMFVAAATLTGCGTPPGLEEEPRPWASGRSSAPVPVLTLPTELLPTELRPGTIPLPSQSTGFSETLLVPCAGTPTGEQVIAILRRSGDLLPTGASARISAGPFCAGTWQISTVSVPNTEPMQVVTSGAPAALKLVTAGTDVCSARVRGAAPVAVRSAACDGAALPTATAVSPAATRIPTPTATGFLR